VRTIDVFGGTQQIGVKSAKEVEGEGKKEEKLMHTPQAN
jgi:hypothetical protein